MIGILGIYYNVRNFGAQLQAKALQAAISAYGYGSVWVRYDYRKGIYNPFVTANIQSEFDGNDGDFWKYYAEQVESELEKRKRAFDFFQDEIPHTAKEYDLYNLTNVMDECDRLMIGGDQVWNAFYYMEHPRGIENFTLAFVPKDQVKISFSASTGGGVLPSEHQKRLALGLKQFDMISVREKSSVSMIQRLAEQRVTCVLDSAFLLSQKDWNKIRKDAPSIRNAVYKFAVCCFMGGFVEWRDSSADLCKKVDVKVLTFPHLGESRYYKADYGFGDIRDFTSGPAEFLDLIEKAEFIITDSFHACVFSIIYNKPFYVFLRDESQRNLKTNGRIEDMLDEFDLTDRIVTPDELAQKNEVEPIDYEKVNKIVAVRRQESIDFLKAALKWEK